MVIHRYVVRQIICQANDQAGRINQDRAWGIDALIIKTSAQFSIQRFLIHYLIRLVHGIEIIGVLFEHPLISGINLAVIFSGILPFAFDPLLLNLLG